MAIHVGSRVKSKKDFGGIIGIEVGDLGTVDQMDDYVPGWDAGIFAVKCDNGKWGLHWTEQELLDNWEAVCE